MRLTATIKQPLRPSIPAWHTLLIEYRKRYKITQDEFAALFDVDRTAVSHWERAKAQPPADVCWLLHRDFMKRKGVK